MAFRSMEIRTLCGICGASATAKCVRCGRPLCVEHVPPPDARCEVCETKFELRVAKKTAAMRRLAIPILGFGASLGLLYLSTSVSVLQPTALAVAACSGLYLDWRTHPPQELRKLMRTRFLEEQPRRTRKALPQ